MYRYDEFDARFVNERVAQFRRQVKRRLEGELTEDQFRPLRLMNGLYLQLHAYMLRVNVPYGTLSSKQMRKFAFIARTYDKNFGHFTTRQNIQYNWIKLEETPDILQHLADVEVTGIQSSGNCVRNITSDQYAGRAKDELADPRVYCELLRQYSFLHPEFSYLPRKFKIAVTGSPNDRAAVAVHDIGLRMHRNEQRRNRLRGARRRRPGPHAVHRPDDSQVARAGAPALVRRVDPAHLQHAGPARQHPQGAHQDHRQSDGHRQVSRARRPGLGVHEERRAQGSRRGSSRASTPISRRRSTRSSRIRPQRWPRSAPADRAFDRWMRGNVVEHKVPGYAIVNVSLKAPGKAPGDITADKMDAVADLADRYSLGEIRVSHRQNLVLVDVKQSELYELWHKLTALELATPNLGLLSDIICCPGLDFLRARERALDSDRAGHQPRVHGSRRAAEDRPVHDQHLGLHERLRPSSRRAHRHLGRRQARRGVLPAHARRVVGSERVARRPARSRLAAGRGAGRDSQDRRCVSRDPRSRTSASSIRTGASASSRSRAAVYGEESQAA